MIEILKNGLKEMKKDLKNNNIKKQLANILTLSRFFSPFVLLPLYFFNKMTLFIIMIIVFSLTDLFDGYFARKYNSYSSFGAYLDAVVDKMFFLTLLIPIFSKYIFMILLMELLISLVNIYAFKHNCNPKTIYIGKIKTTLLFILIGLLYLKKFVVFNELIVIIFFVVTLLLQLISLLLYIKKITK